MVAVGYIGEVLNSWGVVHRLSGRFDASVAPCTSTIASSGSSYFAIDPIKVSSCFEESDEVRLDVEYRHSTARLLVRVTVTSVPDLSLPIYICLICRI